MMRIARHPLVVISLRGSQEQMGRQHGELLRSVGGYEQAVDFYTHLPERLILGASPSRETRPSTARPDHLAGAEWSGRAVVCRVLGSR